MRNTIARLFKRLLPRSAVCTYRCVTIQRDVFHAPPFLMWVPGAISFSRGFLKRRWASGLLSRIANYTRYCISGSIIRLI